MGYWMERVGSLVWRPWGDIDAFYHIYGDLIAGLREIW